MTRTLTPPFDDRGMWRRLVARAHPDAGGDHELFIWTGAVRDAVCCCELLAGPPRRTPPQAKQGDKPRVPYPPETDFAECTRTALRLGASEAGKPYGPVLSLLANCYPTEDLAHEQDRGASYKRLAAIAHLWGMTKAERIGWYRLAEDIPLSDRHAGHILGRLKRRAA
jgi:hypothetical protein